MLQQGGLSSYHCIKRLHRKTPGISKVRTYSSPEATARNENSEVPVYFLKAKQGHTVRKMKKKYI
jgi:hypothetical protein